MLKNKYKLITCNALAKMLQPLVEKDTPVEIMDIGLHANPDHLREHVQAQVTRMEQKGIDILLGYGLCGRGIEGVNSMKSRLVLPRVDDCVGALLGSRERHKKMMKTHPGCFFLESSWLDTEINIFNGLSKGMSHIPPERRDQIIRAALKHYKNLGLLVNGKPDEAAVKQCGKYADAFSIRLRQIPVDMTLLQQLIKGPLDEKDFVITSPGEAIPFF